MLLTKRTKEAFCALFRGGKVGGHRRVQEGREGRGSRQLLSCRCVTAGMGGLWDLAVVYVTAVMSACLSLCLCIGCDVCLPLSQSL